LGQDCLELGEPLLGWILAPEACCPLELGNAWIERAVLVVRRAEIAQARVWLADEPFHDSLSDTRLADPGFAGDQHHATVAPFCLLPPPQEQINLLVAPDKRRGRRAQRLEAALHHARAQHFVCLRPIGEALRLDAAEIAVLKQTAQQAAGGCIDGNGARLRPSLQTRCQVRRLAYDCLLLRRARTN